MKSKKLRVLKKVPLRPVKKCKRLPLTASKRKADEAHFQFFSHKVVDALGMTKHLLVPADKENDE